MIKNLVLAYGIHFAFMFLYFFSYDTAAIWSKEDPPLHMPKLEDLQYNSDSHPSVYHMDSYVKEIISPAYYYFKIVDRIEHYQNNAEYSGCMLFPLFQLISISCNYDALSKLQFAKYEYWYLIIAIITTIIGDLILYKLYKITSFAIKHFVDDKHYTKKSFYESAYDQAKGKVPFGISKENFVNNMILDMHFGYVLSIEKTVIIRHFLRPITAILSVIVYVLLSEAGIL